MGDDKIKKYLFTFNWDDCFKSVNDYVVEWLKK